MTGAMSQTWTRFLPSVIRNKLHGRHDVQKAISNSGWLFAENILRSGVGFFVNAWIIRYLGPEKFGFLSYAIAFTALFSPLAQLGLDAVVVRTIVQNSSRQNEIIGSAFALKLFSAVATIALTMASIAVLRPEDRLSQALVGISILGTLFQSFGVIDFWFQAGSMSKYSVIAKTAACLTIFAVKITLILTGGSLQAFAWVGLAELLFISAGLLVAYHIAGMRLKFWKPTQDMMFQLLRDSWLLMVADLIYFAYLRIDRIMVGEISGPTELGAYSVAVLVAEAFFFIPASISLSIFPGIIKAHAESPILFKKRMQQYYALMAFLGYLTALPLSLVAEWLIPLAFGTSYSRTVPMLLVLIWGGVSLNMIHARSYFLTAMNWARLHLVLDLVGCLINITLNIFLIPAYGGMGAAVASVVTYFLTAYVLCFAFKSLRETGIMMTKAMLWPKFW
jgi:O-antigen/teichoic acid export membrane protein